MKFKLFQTVPRGWPGVPSLSSFANLLFYLLLTCLRVFSCGILCLFKKQISSWISTSCVSVTHCRYLEGVVSHFVVLQKKSHLLFFHPPQTHRAKTHGLGCWTTPPQKFLTHMVIMMKTTKKNVLWWTCNNNWWRCTFQVDHVQK